MVSEKELLKLDLVSSQEARLLLVLNEARYVADEIVFVNDRDSAARPTNAKAISV